MGRMIPNENSWVGFSPNLAGATLAAPVQSALATATTGGTIVAGVYYYKVTTLQGANETIGSNEQTITVPATTATNTVTVTWAAVAGATGYRIYRGISSGGQNRIVATVGVVTTSVDTGAATTAGSPPTINTTGTINGINNIASPTTAEINNSVDLTGFVISITAQTTGNTVPTPTLKTKFETTIQGTFGASLTADFYRDDQSDTAWAVLPRNVKGFVIISRFGGRSTTNPGQPIAGDIVEVWPIIVVARSASGLSSNTAEMFTMQASIPTPPNEAAVVAA